MEDSIHKTIKAEESTLRSIEQAIKNGCRKLRKVANEVGTAADNKQRYLQSAPMEYTTNLNIMTYLFFLVMGYIITAAIYYTDRLLLNDAAEYFAKSGMKELASYILPAILLAAEVGVIMLAVKSAEQYSKTGFKPTFYNGIQTLKFFPVAIVLLSVAVKYSVQVNQDDYILLQYIAFGLLLLGLHLLAIFCGKYLLLGLMLPVHWIIIWKLNQAIKQEKREVENTRNSIKDTCVRYRTEYNKYLNLVSKAREFKPSYTFNNI